MLYFLKAEKLKEKTKTKTYKGYVPITLMMSIILSICSLYHAVCSFFNIIIVLVFILNFMKARHSRVSKIAYLVAITALNFTSVCIAAMIVIAAVSTYGTDKFGEVLSTL